MRCIAILLRISGHFLRIHCAGMDLWSHSLSTVRDTPPTFQDGLMSRQLPFEQRPAAQGAHPVPASEAVGHHAHRAVTRAGECPGRRGGRLAPSRRSWSSRCLIPVLRTSRSACAVAGTSASEVTRVEDVRPNRSPAPAARTAAAGPSTVQAGLAADLRQAGTRIAHVTVATEAISPHRAPTPAATACSPVGGSALQAGRSSRNIQAEVNNVQKPLISPTPLGKQGGVTDTHLSHPAFVYPPKDSQGRRQLDGRSPASPSPRPDPARQPSWTLEGA